MALSTLRSSGRDRNVSRGRGLTGSLAALTCLGLASCGESLPDDWSDTDEHGGVVVVCQNVAADDGLDVTGADADADADGGDQNYWYESCEAMPNPPTVVCYASEGSLSLDCYCKTKYQDGLLPDDGGVSICVGEGTPPGLGPVSDFANGGYPEFNDEIRDLCSAKCPTLNAVNESTWMNYLPDLEPKCVAADWSGVQTKAGWAPPDPPNCDPMNFLNTADPDGSAIDWSIVGGLSVPIPLNCDLDGDCVSWFYPDVARFVTAPGAAEIIDPETRTAHFLGVEGSGSQLALDMWSTGDDTEPLFGLAEYSVSDCGEDVCPFYLGNASAFNATDVWDITVETTAGRISKQISNVQIDLVQSTLGVMNTSLDIVAFAPGALRFRVQVTIGSCMSCSSFGDGTYARIVENQDYVFADYDAGALELEYEFDVQSLGTGTLTISVEPDEYPPEADHDLGATEDCDHIDGLVLDAARSFSTDPENDIVHELWWVDGEPWRHDNVLPFGSHSVSLEARDSRGAVHRTDHQWVYVDVAAPCAVLP